MRKKQKKFPRSPGLLAARRASYYSRMRLAEGFFLLTLGGKKAYDQRPCGVRRASGTGSLRVFCCQKLVLNT